MKTYWKDRQLLGEDGFSITSVTAQTAQDVFERYQQEVEKFHDQLARGADEFKAQRESKQRVTVTPQWARARNTILNLCAQRAGLVDS